MEKGRVGSDSQEDDSLLNPERKSKGNCRHCGKMEKLEPGRRKPKEGAERGGEKLREEVKPEARNENGWGKERKMVSVRSGSRGAEQSCFVWGWGGH